jgi:hypothetical protein
VHDAREIRAMGQQNGVDIFGANGLGVGGRLEPRAHRPARWAATARRRAAARARSRSSPIRAGSRPPSRSTCAWAGWGTTTVISSGKDVYIHYAAPEFAFALANDARSKAAGAYCEPGGYYELDAHFTKPVVACRGRPLEEQALPRGRPSPARWPGGPRSDALAQERWFMDNVRRGRRSSRPSAGVLGQGRGW